MFLLRRVIFAELLCSCELRFDKNLCQQARREHAVRSSVGPAALNNSNLMGFFEVRPAHVSLGLTQISPPTVSMERFIVGSANVPISMNEPENSPEYRLGAAFRNCRPFSVAAFGLQRRDGPKSKPRTGMRVRGLTIGTEDSMTNLRWTLLAAHRGNLERYRRITTPLTAVERSNVKLRMKEERQQIKRLQHELETEHPLALSA